MKDWQKLQKRILGTQKNQGFRFDEICRLLKKLGFDETVKGSHHVFKHSGLQAIVNLQPTKDREVKPYQLRQLRKTLKVLSIPGKQED